MPWTAAQFKARHNRKLTLGQAGKAAKQATAMIKSGVDEGIAIATANKHAGRANRKNRYSNPRKASLTGQQVAGTGTGVEAGSGV